MALGRDEFYSLVKNMRAAQREFFRTRSKESLQKSKKLERHVDDEIYEYEAFNCIEL